MPKATGVRAGKNLRQIMRTSREDLDKMFDQSEFEIRCEWGEKGISQLAPISDAIIIVDVLSFSTSVEVATNRGAIVYPYQAWDEDAKTFAASINAELAGPRGESKYSLSPASLVDISAGTELVLPSLNGATLTLAVENIPTLTGCLRNCRAVAEAAMRFGKKLSVIPAGERWKDDSSIRFAIEDFIGAGSIIQYLSGGKSPESEAAVTIFKHALENLCCILEGSVSGRELAVLGYEKDILLAAELDISDCVPIFANGSYTKG